MNVDLQNKIIMLSLIFFIVITFFVKRKDLQIKHSLIWYFASVSLIVVAIFPGILNVISNWFGIVDITNAVYLIIIAFLLLIVFLNNVTISKHQETITLLVQEISILKLEMEGKTDDICASDNSVNNACNRANSVED